MIASPDPRERYYRLRHVPAFGLVQTEVGAFLLRNLAGVVELAPDLGPGGAELFGVQLAVVLSSSSVTVLTTRKATWASHWRANPAAKSTAFLALCDPCCAEYLSVMGGLRVSSLWAGAGAR